MDFFSHGKLRYAERLDHKKYGYTGDKRFCDNANRIQIAFLSHTGFAEYERAQYDLCRFRAFISCVVGEVT